MPAMTMVQAIQDALRTALREDPDVVLLGEDIGRNGGVFRVTEGLQSEFGAERVADTPLAENGIVGAAIGMALYGLRPVAEIQFVDFIYPAFDQIVSEMAKMRWRSAGQYACPLVVRAPYGGGIKGGLYHSQSPEAYFCHTAGLTVVIPSTPSDAKGLLLSALGGDDPVIFLEPKRLYRTTREDVGEGHFTIPLRSARVAREGDQVTVLAWGAMVPVSVEAAEKAAANGTSVEVVDLRTLVPLDVATITASVNKTSRAVVLHEDARRLGYGAEIAATVAEECFWQLDGPVVRIAGKNTPIPTSPALEDAAVPQLPEIISTLRRVATT